MPKTSSLSSTPGERRDSASRRSLVALSNTQEIAFDPLGFIGKAREDGDAAVSVLGGDEAMGIAAVDETGGEQELPTATATVEEAAHAEHTKNAGASQEPQRRRVGMVTTGMNLACEVH